MTEQVMTLPYELLVRWAPAFVNGTPGFYISGVATYSQKVVFDLDQQTFEPLKQNPARPADLPLSDVIGQELADGFAASQYLLKDYDALVARTNDLAVELEEVSARASQLEAERDELRARLGELGTRALDGERAAAKSAHVGAKWLRNITKQHSAGRSRIETAVQKDTTAAEDVIALLGASEAMFAEVDTLITKAAKDIDVTLGAEPEGQAA